MGEELLIPGHTMRNGKTYIGKPREAAPGEPDRPEEWAVSGQVNVLPPDIPVRGELVALPAGWTMSLTVDVATALDHAQCLLTYIARVRHLGQSPGMSGEEKGAEVLLRRMIADELNLEQHKCGEWNHAGPYRMIGDETWHVAKFCSGCGAALESSADTPVVVSAEASR